MRWRIPAICDILPPEGDLQYFQIPICLCKSADSSCMPPRDLYGFRTWSAELPLCSLFLCHLTDSLSLCLPLWVSDKYWLLLTSLASLCAGRQREWHRLKKFLCWPYAGYRLSLFFILQRILSRSMAADLWQSRKSLAGKKKKWWHKTHIDTTATHCLPHIEHFRPPSFTGERVRGSSLLSATAWVSTDSACNHCWQHMDKRTSGFETRKATAVTNQIPFLRWDGKKPESWTWQNKTSRLRYKYRRQNNSPIQFLPDGVSALQVHLSLKISYLTTTVFCSVQRCCH